MHVRKKIWQFCSAGAVLLSSVSSYAGVIDCARDLTEREHAAIAAEVDADPHLYPHEKEELKELRAQAVAVLNAMQENGDELWLNTRLPILDQLQAHLKQVNHGEEVDYDGISLELQMQRVVRSLLRKRSKTTDHEEQAAIDGAIQGIETYVTFQSKVSSLGLSGMDFRDFDYPILEPFLKQVIMDLRVRKRESTDLADQAQVEKVIQGIQTLIMMKIPYGTTMRYLFKYTDVLDSMFHRIYPNLKGDFHRTNAAHVLEMLIADAPDVLLFPSYEPVGPGFFVRSRAAPFHLVGVTSAGLRKGEAPPFADGFEMMPSEFTYHDLGHIEYMWGRDVEYLDSALNYKPIERVVQEWTYTSRRIIKFWNSMKGDKDLYDAMEMLLFEILHERGYQWSMSVLRAQLETPKWIEILERKRTNNYFREFHNVNYALFPRLEEARKLLFDHLTSLRVEDQKVHLSWTNSSEAIVRVTHYPRIGYGIARLQRIEILSPENIQAVTQTESGETLRPQLENLVLAQVSGTKNSPLTKAMKEKINAILRAREAGAEITRLGEPVKVKGINVYTDRHVLAVLEDGRVPPITELEVPAEFNHGKELVEEGHFFKMVQSLGSEDRETPLHFTLHEAPQKYIGKVTLLPNDDIVIHTKSGNVTIPLSEALVDPVRHEDFPPSPRRTRTSSFNM